MQSIIQSGIPYIMLTAAMLIGLVATVINDPFISRTHRNVMLMITVVCTCLIVQNYIDSTLSFSEATPLVIRLRTLISVIGYALRPVVIILFFYIIRMDRRYNLAWVLAGINLAVYATAFYSGICFSINNLNHWVDGPLSKCCHTYG